MDGALGESICLPSWKMLRFWSGLQWQQVFWCYLFNHQVKYSLHSHKSDQISFCENELIWLAQHMIGTFHHYKKKKSITTLSILSVYYHWREKYFFTFKNIHIILSQHLSRLGLNSRLRTATKTIYIWNYPAWSIYSVTLVLLPQVKNDTGDWFWMVIFSSLEDRSYSSAAIYHKHLCSINYLSKTCLSQRKCNSITVLC